MNHLNTNRIRTAILLLVVLAAGVVIGMLWSKLRDRHRGSETGSSAATQPAAAGDTERRVLYWHDPMKPEVRFDKPGKSPFMDMPLQPVYADDGGSGDASQPSVRVGAAVRHSLGIRLGTVERAEIATAVHAVGEVAYDEAAQVVVQPRADGYVQQLRVRAPLEYVRHGQILADVDVPAWREALAEYLALAAPTDAESRAATMAAESHAAAPGVPGRLELRTALRQRLSVLGVPDETVHEVEQSGRVPARFVLASPVDGVVTDLGLRAGASFTSGTVLARINRLDTVWVDGQMPESDARALVPGTRVTIRANAYPGHRFSGRVLRVLPQVDPVTRTVGARVAVDNPSGRLSPGMYVEVAFPGRASGSQLWVPSEAVIATGRRSVVIVARAGGGFDVATVTTGAAAQGRTAILSGLEAGQSVVLSGQFLIDSEANLKSAINRLTDAGAQP